MSGGRGRSGVAALDAPGDGNTAYAPPAIRNGLIAYRPLDAVVDLDQKWADHWNDLDPVFSGHSEAETHNMLQSQVSQSNTKHQEVTTGLLFAILTQSERAKAKLYYRLLSQVSRDACAYACQQVQHLVHERYKSLKEGVGAQILWLTQEFIQSNIRDTGSIVLALLRQMAGGDVSSRNCSLAATLVHMLTNNKSWLATQSKVLATAFYSFTRLVTDHSKSQFSQLRGQEIALCQMIWDEHFGDLIPIGRDLIRVLQDVSQIPQFRAMFKQLIESPSSLQADASFRGIGQILRTPTPKHFLRCRVTPEMEKQLVFLLSQVKQGHERRYRQWLAQKFLVTPESSSIVADWIRFVICVHHPSNQILRSDIVQRWALLGWLLQCSKGLHRTSNDKLALFFDWMFYDSSTKTGVMHIEPAILLMVHSIPKYVELTAALLDFILLEVENYYPPLRDTIAANVRSAFRHAAKVGIVQSVDVLATFPGLDQKLREQFRRLLSNEQSSRPVTPENVSANDAPASKTTDSADSGEVASAPPSGDAPSKASPEKAASKPEASHSSSEDETLPGLLKEFSGSIRTAFSGSTVELEELFSLVDSAGSDEDTCDALAEYLTSRAREEFSDTSQVVLDDGLVAAVFQACNQGEALTDSAATAVLYRMARVHKSTGYRFLAYLARDIESEDDYAPYRSLMKHRTLESAESQLFGDMRHAYLANVSTFLDLMPTVWRYLPDLARGKPDLLHLYVTCVDSSHLTALSTQILCGEVSVFGSGSDLSTELLAMPPVTGLDARCLWDIVAVSLKRDLKAFDALVPALFQEKKFKSNPDYMHAFVQLLGDVDGIVGRTENRTSEAILNRLTAALLGLADTGLSTELAVPVLCMWHRRVDAETFSEALVDAIKVVQGDEGTGKWPHTLGDDVWSARFVKDTWGEFVHKLTPSEHAKISTSDLRNVADDSLQLAFPGKRKTRGDKGDKSSSDRRPVKRKKAV